MVQYLFSSVFQVYEHSLYMMNDKIVSGGLAFLK